MAETRFLCVILCQNREIQEPVCAMCPVSTGQAGFSQVRIEGSQDERLRLQSKATWLTFEEVTRTPIAIRGAGCGLQWSPWHRPRATIQRSKTFKCQADMGVRKGVFK
jgi:hypothetical protein